MKRNPIFRICLAVFLALFLSASTSVAMHRLVPDLPDGITQIFPSEIYPDFTYNGLAPSCAACPDPTNCSPQFSFFVKGGTVNKLVIYFQGGGACWDSMNCLYYPTYSRSVPPLELVADTAGKGILDTANPANPFKDWYFVYIPYCTGDIHWGARDNSYPDYLGAIPGVDSWTIRHRGFVNFQVVLKWVQDNFLLPRKIFVTGSSAGSYGAIMGFPYIREAYPWSVISVLGDAGNGVVEPYFQTTAIYNWDVQIPAWIPGFEAGYTPDMTMSDMYTGIAAYYPLSKVAQFSTAWDWNQTFFYNVMLNIHDPGSWGEAYWPLVWCDWNQQMLGLAHDTAAAAPNYRYYISAGIYHTIMTSPDFYTESSAGVPFVEWVDAMVNNPFGLLHPRFQGKWKNLECEDCGDPVPCP